MTNEIINFLKGTYNSDDFNVINYDEDSFFGKDRNNNCLFAIKKSCPGEKYSFSTKSLILYENTSLTLINNNEEKKDIYDAIILKSEYYHTINTFVNICLNFYKNVDDSILKLTEDLIEIYDQIKEKNIEKEIGLWGELFFILYFIKEYNINLLNFWHNDNFNKFDFSIGDNIYIEIKSTIKEMRIHNFSHNQIYNNNKVFIVSNLLQKDDKGCSINDLYGEIKKLDILSYKQIKKIENELFKFEENDLNTYNLNYSNDNIRLYLNSEIPCYSEKEPNGISNTKYNVDLEVSNSLNFIELKKCIEEEL